MFDTLCALPLSADLFAHAVHPNNPIVAIGLASGHVATLKLPDIEDSGSVVNHSADISSKRSRGRRGSNGTDVIDTVWRTKRHQESCRALAYSVDGAQLYSGGADGIVKAADAETGRVTGKFAIPASTSSIRAEADPPTVIHALSPQTLLLATDSSALHLFDLRDPSPSLPIQQGKQAFVTGRPAQTHYPHSDYISSLTPIPPSSASTSGFSKQWLTTGGTTLALTDLRRGVLVKSEDQEEILLSSLYISGLPARKSSGSSGEKAVIGGGDGVITLWEKGQYDDQDERITVSREKETVDCMAEIPDGVGGPGKKIAVGLGDGKVRFVRLGMNKVVGEVSHHDLEGVTELSFDVGGRMITGGGDILKVWREAIQGDREGEDEDSEDGTQAKRAVDSDGDDDDDDEKSEGDSDDDDEMPRQRRKKRKRGKGPAPTSNFNFAGLD